MTDFSDLLVHPKTKKQAGYFLQKPHSPLLIFGERGSGKRRLAYSLACSVLGLKSARQLLSFPYFFYAKRDEGKQDISIDTVRQINRFLRLKTPGGKATRRIVLIEDAQNLSQEAQNALLKILEEPNDDTMFLLTAPYELSLLPTIVSRCQQIWAYPVSLQQAESFYGGKFGHQKMESAWRLSRGGPAILDALLVEEGSHPLKQSVEKAKAFLRQSQYERLLSLDQMNKDKEDLKLFLEALSKILAALHRSALGKRPRQARNLVSDRKLTMISLEALDKNANSRLICLNLVLNLKS